MKAKLKTGFAALALVLATAFGVNAADAKTGVLDFQKVMNNANASKRALAELGQKQKAAQAKIDALEKPLVEKQEKLRSQQSVMAADKFQQAQMDFAKELGSFREQAQKIQYTLDEQNMAYRKKITDAVKESVDEVAKEKGLEVVLLRNTVAYFSSSVVDVTDDVLARTNKKLDK